MPGLQTLLNELNHAFGKDRLAGLAAHRENFAPGQSLGSGLIVREGTPLFDEYQQYLRKQLPESIQQSLLGVIYYALGTKDAEGNSRPTQITFAWAPAYDYEITIWEVGDTTRTKGGITVLIRSPYDKQSLKRRGKPES